VYLAQDTRLKRKVALKILPADVASDEDRMRRFTQEAEAAAALSHPNIAHIYEIGEKDGTHFISMEYVDGVTLAGKIHGEKTPLRKLLKYLTQVAEGLAKAHAEGIVHRDLKPDNIMVARDDYAKILDFGLAKLVEPQRPKGAGGGASSEVATALLAQHSTPGMVMGTVGYMSPEQAQGRVREIDHRSDIFSFGCILYEAATGRKAFEGKDQLDSLHKIVHAPAPPIRDVNPDAPPDLQRIVRRCLAKEPDRRYQSVKDVAIELDELRREMKGAEESGLSYSPEAGQASRASEILNGTISLGDKKAAPTAGTVAPPTSSAEYLAGEVKKHKLGAAVVAVSLALVLAGAGYAVYRLTTRRDKPALSFQAAKITRLTTTGKASGVAISPDGKYVVHVQDDGGQQSLWTRQVATQSNVQIVAPAAAVSYTGLTFSPDGNFVYYVVSSQEFRQRALFQVPTLGGEPKKLLEHVLGSPVTFSPDGKQFAFVRPTQGKEFALMIADADGTNERKLLAHKNPPEAIGAPAWSPDGKRIAYRVLHYDSNDSTVYEAQVAGGSTKALTARRWLRINRLVWMSDGSGLLMLATPGQRFVHQIWHLSYPEGEARQLTNDLNNYPGMSLTADTGTMAVVESETQASIWLAPAGDASSARPVTSGSGKADVSHDWTPDGRIVYHSNASGSDDIWLVNVDGGNPKQLTANARINDGPVVSPDGRHIVFYSDRTGAPHLWRMNIDGSDQRQLTYGAVGEQSPQFSPDGRWVVYRTAMGRPTVWRIPADGGEPVQLTDKHSISPTVSPDSKMVAYYYSEDENAPWRIAVAPLEGGEPLKTFDVSRSFSSPSLLRWTHDGRAVAYLITRDGVSNIFAQPLDGGAPKQLTDFKAGRIFSFAFSRDGKQLALSRGTVNSDVVLISNFK
jgi:eukaryotic-like serine/threonine-protein kinase